MLKWLLSLFRPKKNKVINSVFKLSLANRSCTFKTGINKDPYDKRDKIKVLLNVDETMLSSNNEEISKNFSLRQYAPKTSNFNQRSTGACGGFSASAMIYIIVKRMQSLVDKAADVNMFSPLWIYWYARLNDGVGSTQRDEGTHLRSVMKALANPGAIEEKYWSFARHRPIDEPDSKAIMASTFKLHNYMRIPLQQDGTIQLVKDILSKEQLPLLVGLLLYREQSANAKWDGHFRPVRNKAKAESLGGHALCITGYYTDKKGQCYLEFINSWSDQWGDKGYGYFPIEWLNDPFYVMDMWCVDKGYF